jgi:hypothetical protein
MNFFPDSSEVKIPFSRHPGELFFNPLHPVFLIPHLWWESWDETAHFDSSMICTPRCKYVRFGVAGWYISTQNLRIYIGKFWRASEWKMLDFYVRLEYFTAIWYISYCHLVHFSPFWYATPRKILHPWYVGCYYNVYFPTFILLKYIPTSWLFFRRVDEFFDELVNFWTSWWIFRLVDEFFDDSMIFWQVD